MDYPPHNLPESIRELPPGRACLERALTKAGRQGIVDDPFQDTYRMITHPLPLPGWE